MNNTSHPGVIETVKDKTVAATEGTGHIVEKVVDTAAEVLTTTVKDTKVVLVGAEHAVAGVAGGAIEAAGEVGATAVDAVRKTVHGDKAGLKGPGQAAAR